MARERRANDEGFSSFGRISHNRLYGLLRRWGLYRFLGLLRTRVKDERKGEHDYLAGHNGEV